MYTWAISHGLIAAKDKAVLDERLLWTTGALVGALLTGAAILALVDRWRKRQLSDAEAAEADPLTPYREMYARGEISREEYRHIRTKLAEQYYEIANKPTSAGDDGSAPADGGAAEPRG